MTTTTPDTDTPLHRIDTHRPGTARAALSYRDFRILFVGTALSSIGTWMQNFTLPAYVDSRTGSASLVGLLVFVQLGPLLLLSIPAGMLADRVESDTARDRDAVGHDGDVDRAGRARSPATRRSGRSSPPSSRSGSPTRSTPRRSVPASRCSSTARTSPARDQSQLGDDQRHPDRRAGDSPPVLAAVGLLGRPAVRRQRRHLPVPHRARSPFVRLPQVRRRTARARLAQADERDQPRADADACSPARCSTMFLFSLVCLPYIGLFPSVARLNFGLDARESALQVALHRVGTRRLLRRARRRHLAVALATRVA